MIAYMNGVKVFDGPRTIDRFGNYDSLYNINTFVFPTSGAGGGMGKTDGVQIGHLVKL